MQCILIGQRLGDRQVFNLSLCPENVWARFRAGKMWCVPLSTRERQQKPWSKVGPLLEGSRVRILVRPAAAGCSNSAWCVLELGSCRIGASARPVLQWWRIRSPKLKAES